jgi:hypothetical protein
MSFLFKRGFLVGFLPGFLFLTGVVFVWKDYNIHCLFAIGSKLSVPLGIGIIIISFIIGQVFDSIRDRFFEPCHKKNINWDFFYEAPKEQIEKLDDNYYIWYVLNTNLVISLIGLLIFVAFHALFGKVKITPWAVVIVSILSMIPLWMDANSLHEDVAKHTQKKKEQK